MTPTAYSEETLVQQTTAEYLEQQQGWRSVYGYNNEDFGPEGDQGPYDISRIDFDRLRREFAQSPAKKTIVQSLKQAVESRLQRLLRQNPLRTDLQLHYEKIIAEYNREKDRATIEQTFEELFRLEKALGDEERRTVREGLDEESLAVFDLLRKPDLTPKEIKRIKKVSVELIRTLKEKIREIDHWQDRESSRDAVRLVIHDFLWSDSSGLPVDHYTEDNVKIKADEVYGHMFRVYPRLPSPYYGHAATA